MWKRLRSAEHTSVIYWELDPHSTLTLYSFMSKEMFFLMDCPLNTSVMEQGQSKISLDNAIYLDTPFTMYCDFIHHPVCVPITHLYHRCSAALQAPPPSTWRNCRSPLLTFPIAEAECKVVMLTTPYICGSSAPLSQFCGLRTYEPMNP